MFDDLEGISNRIIDVGSPEEFDDNQNFDDSKVISNESMDFDELMIQKCAVISIFDCLGSSLGSFCHIWVQLIHRHGQTVQA